MSEIKEIQKNVYEGTLNPANGDIGNLIKEFGAKIIIGHPTFQNHDNIPLQLKKGIIGASEVFENEKVAFIITDGTLNSNSSEKDTIDAALKSAIETIGSLPAEKQENIFVFAGPYDGYDGDKTPGKGSALKMAFEEMGNTDAEILILLDGDLKNEMAEWQAVYKRVLESHKTEYPGQNFFITARYARHFVDASLTRNVVGPLTTLMGKYVPGGISGDIVLSSGAVALERAGKWGEARRKYGTDISTTFDNIADNTVIYEVYLGAKLHDVTDDAKLAIMPGEVIGAALERLVHYEKDGNRVTKLLASDKPLTNVVEWGPEKTGIDFINPGFTDVFKLKAKRATLVTKYADFKEHMEKTLTAETFKMVEENYAKLVDAVDNDKDTPLFMGISSSDWIIILNEVVGYTLVTSDIESAKKSLNYLYTAAFLEFCADKMAELGYKTASEIESVQSKLGLTDDVAKPFYDEKVDKVVKDMAMEFYDGRKAILERMKSVAK